MKEKWARHARGLCRTIQTTISPGKYTTTIARVQLKCPASPQPPGLFMPPSSLAQSRCCSVGQALWEDLGTLAPASYMKQDVPSTLREAHPFPEDAKDPPMRTLLGVGKRRKLLQWLEQHVRHTCTREQTSLLMVLVDQSCHLLWVFLLFSHLGLTGENCGK